MAVELHRVAARPFPEDWGEDELMTIPEAATLFWPSGPITTSTLRNAARRGKLRVVELAGKHFTNKRAVEEMCRSAAPLTAAPDATETMKRDLLDELDALKRRRAGRKGAVA